MPKKEKIETLEMSITPDYVPHWTTAAALREFLQNALDSQTQGFSMELDEDEKETHITNFGAELPIKTLLLGMTTKIDSEDEIGQFGEGYKLACLVLAREKVYMRISSPQGTIIPSISYSSRYESDILKFTLEKEKTFLPGVRISFSKAKVSLSWLRSFILEDQPQVHRILHNKPGRIYSNGLHLDIDIDSRNSDNFEESFHWGYNIPSKKLKLDRDRRMVNKGSLVRAIISILEETGTSEEIYDACEMPFPELKGGNDYLFSNTTSERLIEVFKEKYGEKAFACCVDEPEEFKRLIKRAGFLLIEIESKLLFNLITKRQPNSADLIKIADGQVGKKEPYTPTFQEAERLDKAIILLKECHGTIDNYHYHLGFMNTFKVSPVLFNDPTILGLFDREEETIFISAKTLDSTGKILTLLLHELVHSDIDGHDKEFQDEFENLIMKVFNFLI